MDANFFKMVKKTESCWLWLGALDGKGYGRITRAGKNYSAHRWSYGLRSGHLEPGTGVLRHSCDNPRCVNPDHLSLGSQAENMGDMHRKGRQSMHAAKVSPKVACEIRDRYRQGGISQLALGRLFGISQQQVSNIVRGTKWKVS